MATSRDRVIPIFRIFDEDKAREFYVDFLGFTVDWEHRFEPGLPLYMQVSRGGIVLHLSGHHGDACPGATAFVYTTGLRDYQRALIAKQYKHLRPGVEPAPWNDAAITMTLTDPFGNRLRLCEDPAPRRP